MESAPEKSSLQSFNETLKLDHHGLPLIPQPSDDPEDPLNWSRTQKYIIVCISALIAFLGTFALGSSAPAYAQIGLALGVTATQASYIGTIGIAAAGIRSFIWTPLSNVYGRRPILIFSQAIAIAAGFGAAFAKSYGTIIVGRFFTGLGSASGHVVAFAVVSDVFCLHERGNMLGIVTFALINGVPTQSHVAALPAGFIAQDVGWRWTIKLPSILTAVCWVLIIVALPETLYIRGTGAPPVKSPSRYHRMRITGTRAPGRTLQLVDFVRPFQMLKYFPVVTLGWFAAVAYTLGAQVLIPILDHSSDSLALSLFSVMPSQTVSALFRTYYKWGSAHTGIALSVSTTIGGILGEIVSGPDIDKLMERSRKREGHVCPESRLHGMWPAIILLPTGLLMFGFSITHHELTHSYIGVTVSMALTGAYFFFLPSHSSLPFVPFRGANDQHTRHSLRAEGPISPPVSCVLMCQNTDCVDCYKPQSADVIQLLNFARQEMSFTVGFWSIQYGDKIGFKFSAVTYASVSVFFFLPVLWIMIYGERLRARLGEPGFNKEI
ncbi:MFS general substrate transporter [Mycena sanguinolenta]|uniref:MFS general substrate transporter n=1 Tax=Mycena sanguinolenta TaxID=230812 RepID=A0A8H7DJZ6_9AGAR|nr:MFS general substrate transporter [Mycena sanguinolenta]